MFTDIVASTETNVAVGDERFVALLDEHNDLLQRGLLAHDGVVFHNTGDGYGIWFGAADDAVASALAIHTSARPGRRPPSERIAAGCASASPPALPLSLGGDLFGVDVVRASRLCTLVGAGETAIDAATAGALSRAQGTPLGLVVLKGFVEPEPVYVLRAP